MKKLVIYIHGKGGSAEEAEHYRALFAGYDVLGFDYKAAAPWEAEAEFAEYFDSVSAGYDTVTLAANSLGAYFAMLTLGGKNIDRAFFVSPVVDMEKLITDMITWAGVTEEKLREQKEIPTSFGETLSWEYLSYVREHPINWGIPTSILYGENDELTSYPTVAGFAAKTGAELTVMKNGEHWFHTDEEMEFLDNWLSRRI